MLFCMLGEMVPRFRYDRVDHQESRVNLFEHWNGNVFSDLFFSDLVTDLLTGTLVRS